MKYDNFLKGLMVFIILTGSACPALCNDVDNVLFEIEKNMKTVSSVQADFIQNKKMAMFDTPIKIKGNLFIENPGKFAWKVVEPIEYILIITDDLIKKWDSSEGVRELSLKGNPMFKAMIEQITFWFSGSYASCKKDYDIAVSKNINFITLVFTPKKDNQASKVLSNITLVFKKNKKYISKIQLLERNNDLTEILFYNTKINSPIDKSIWEISR